MMGERICKVEGCAKPVRARGWCSKHYDRWRSTGDPLGLKIREAGQGSPNGHGYWRHKVQGKSVFAHRLIMSEQLGRPLEPWEKVHHKDRDKLNNNPGNLELTTEQEHHRRHATYRSETEKECSICHEVKPRTEFAWRNTPGRDPHSPRCKACHNARYPRTGWRARRAARQNH